MSRVVSVNVGIRQAADLSNVPYKTLQNRVVEIRLKYPLEIFPDTNPAVVGRPAVCKRLLVSLQFVRLYL